ncbi:hypothetical protein SAMD00023378_4117 [Ralstonia sp. NT80]|nr:hypothetical protein SAMD00023378_4117 [Ralstonia sp. NT80]
MPDNNRRSPDKNKVPTRDSSYERKIPRKEDYAYDSIPGYPGKTGRIMPRDQLTPPPPTPRKKGA